MKVSLCQNWYIGLKSGSVIVNAGTDSDTFCCLATVSDRIYIIVEYTIISVYA